MCPKGRVLDEAICICNYKRKDNALKSPYSLVSVHGPHWPGRGRGKSREPAMNGKPKIVAVAGAIALALSGPLAAEEPPYPVWWSESLELESLEAMPW